MMIDTRVYRFPPAFYDDHIMRDCDGGKELRRTRSYVEVELDRDSFDDLHSDAVYHLDSGIASEMGFGYAGLRRSAAATLRRLDEIGAPDPLPAEEVARRQHERDEADKRTADYHDEQSAIRAAEKAERNAVDAERREREDALPFRVLSRLCNRRDDDPRREPGYPDLTPADANRILDEREARSNKRRNV